MSPDPRFNTVHAAIEAGGGLAITSDLAVRWGVSLARAAQLVNAPSFPTPVARVGKGQMAVWLVDEADAWRAARLSRSQ